MRCAPIASQIALIAVAAAMSARPAQAQHGGIILTANYTRSSDDEFLNRATSAKGVGAELIVSMGESPIYGFASLDAYRGEAGSQTANFGVYNIGFKYWPKAFDPGFRPWVGGALGLGGAGPGVTPVVLGGVGWARKKQRVMPFLAAEYSTRRERTYLKLGLLLGG